jgi:hypothetical protein
MKTRRICLLSGPRNVSTALMYSFAQRQDTRVVDEPLYAHYLRVSGVDHPGRDEILAAQDNDGERVVRDILLGPTDRPVLFLKLMANQVMAVDRGFLAETRNVFLVRNPEGVLPSFDKVVPRPSLADIGLADQVLLLEELRALGQDPAILDSRELLLDPPGVLDQLCRRLDIPFDSAMLSWSAGRRAEDGVWAPHWYDNLHRSTGFAPYHPQTKLVPPHLEDVLAECRPYYETLFRDALLADA